MANSAVVGVLRALLTLDSADFEKGIRKVNQSAKTLSKDMRQIGRQMSDVGMALTKTLTLPLAGLGIAAAKAAMDFESSFANVAKTVDGVSDASGTLTVEGRKLANTFRQMAKEIPATTDELNAIAALGGQMGVPITQLEKFTRNVAALSVAVDGISAEEAAAGLAQIGNIFGKGMREIDKMSSALVHLGNNSNATEGAILEFSKRLAGAGNAVGMTEAEVFALGTAMANVGINAEAGGTAMSQMIAKMSMAVSKGGEALEAFNRVVAHTGRSFADIWTESPIQAINAVVVGLNNAKANGEDLNLTVRSIGATNVRTADTMKRLAGAGDGVAQSLQVANEGFSTSNKHLEEAQKKYATTANQLKLFWNQINDIGITLGNTLLPIINDLIRIASSTLIPVIDKLAVGFSLLPSHMKLGAVAMAGLVAAAGPLLFIAGQLVLAVSSLTAAFAANGIASRALTAAQGALAGSTGILTGALRLLGGAAAVVGVAFAGWQIGRWIGEVTGLTGAIQRTAESMLNLRDTSVPLGEQQKLINLAIQKGAAATITFAEAMEFLRKQNEARLKQWQDEQAAARGSAGAIAAAAAATAGYTDELAKHLAAVRALTPEQKRQIDAARRLGESQKDISDKLGIAQQVLQLYTSEIKATAKADREAEQASERLEKALEKKRAALEKVGVVTRDQVNARLAEFHEIIQIATAEGVPFTRVIQALWPELAELARQAKASRTETDDLAATMAMAGQVISRSFPAANIKISQGLDQALLRYNAISGATVEATAKADLLKGAYQALGITTQAELNRAAQVARDAYRRIAESGTATAEQLRAARDKVLEAERAAAQQTVSIWRDQIFPGVTGVINSLSTAINGSFAQMLLGAKGFKDGFVDIWNSLKASVLNILNQILQAFTQQFLAGMINAMRGQQGAFSQAFAGFMGGGSGGGANWQQMLGGMGGGGQAVPGLPNSNINVGGGFANNFAGASGGGVNWANVAGGGMLAAGGIFQMAKAKTTTQNVLGGMQAGAGIGLMIGGPIGAGIGAGVGALVGWGKSVINSAGKQMNDLRDEFTAKVEQDFGAGEFSGFGGGMGRLGELLSEAGRTDLFHKFMRASNPEEGAKVIEEMTRVIGEHQMTLAQTTAAAERYGLTWEDMGQSVRESKITEIAGQLANETRLLADAGYEHEAILTKQAGAYSQLYQKAMEFGIDIPPSIRAVLVELSEMGLLLDANGNKVLDLSGKNQKALSDLQQSMKAMDEELKTLEDAVANEAPEEVMGVIERQQRARIEAIKEEREQAQRKFDRLMADSKEATDEWGEHTLTTGQEVFNRLRLMYGEGLTIPVNFEMPDGGFVRTGADFGPEVPVADAPMRRVIRSGLVHVNPGDVLGMPHLTRGFEQDLSGMASGTPVILQVDGREIGRVVVPHLPPEARRLGVRVRG